jgi:hypothetical protein
VEGKGVVSAAEPKYIGVIASRAEYEGVAQTLFPGLTKCIAPSRGREGCPFLYRLFAIDAPQDRTFRDINGDELVITKTFTSPDAVQRWVDDHDRKAREAL